MKLKKEEMASMCYIYLLAHGFHNVANISYEKKKKIPIGIDILYQIFMNFYGYLSVKLPLQVENCSFFTYFFFFLCRSFSSSSFFLSSCRLISGWLQFIFSSI